MDSLVVNRSTGLIVIALRNVHLLDRRNLNKTEDGIFRRLAYDASPPFLTGVKSALVGDNKPPDTQVISSSMSFRDLKFSCS